MLVVTLIKVIVFFIFLLIFLVRWLFWLALMQQKEYRCDRIIHFSKTLDGQKALLKILPHSKDFTRTGLKRPVKTLRALTTGITSLLIITSLSYFFGTFGPIYLFCWLVFVLIFMPVIIYLAVLPTTLFYELEIKRQQQQAVQKINQAKPKIIGLTGSYGKTSTKLLLTHVLSYQYSVFATEKSFNTRYSLSKNINQKFVNQELAIIEYAAYKPGEIKHLANLYHPDAAVITGLTDQHLALFKTRQAIIQAKAELVKALPKKGKVFVNGADPGATKIAQYGLGVSSSSDKVHHRQIIPYSGPNSRIKIERVWINQQGRLNFCWQDRLILTRLIGKHYLQACQAAIKIGLEFGLTPETIAQALMEFKPPSYFVNTKVNSAGALIIDDGRTSNPKGFKAALDLLANFKGPNKKLVLVTSGIVDLGQKSEKIHRQLAIEANKLVHLVIYSGREGKAQFENQFDLNVMTKRDKIKAIINRFNRNYIVLIEGHIPQWLRQLLEK